MNNTISGFERLSADFNRGYTKAIQDITKAFGYVNNEINFKKLRWNYSLIMKVLTCFLKNREKFRDDMGTGTGFIRLVKDKKGKWASVEYYDRKEAKKEVLGILVDALADQINNDLGE